MLKQFKNIRIGETFRGTDYSYNHLYKKISDKKYQFILTKDDSFYHCINNYLEDVRSLENIKFEICSIDQFKAEAL